MASPAGRILAGSAVAVLVAVVLGVPTIAGIDTWKIALGVVGLILFVLSGGRRAETK